VLTGKAVEVVRRFSAVGQPFFLYVLLYTPHSPAVAAPRHDGRFAEAELPKTPAFNEADLSDKPAFVRSLLPLDEKRIASSRPITESAFGHSKRSTTWWRA
jgi:N-acetylglucosamine-6-sulfatase